MFRKEKTDVFFNIGVAIAFATVLGLTAAIIALLNTTTATDVPFRMEQLTATDDESMGGIGKYLVPSFVGISVGGECKGVSAGINVASEIYQMLSPVLSDVLEEEYRAASDTRWEEALDGEGAYVYVKYHSPLPYQAIHAFAGGTGQSYADSLCVYELLVLPDRGFQILARTAEGATYQFDGTNGSYFTVDDLAEILQSYRRTFLDFSFSEDAEREPLFTERVRTRKLSASRSGAAWFGEEELSVFLRVLDFNPDKLYAHGESDAGFVYVENHGVLRLLEDCIEYTATSQDGGIALGSLPGYYSKEEYTLSEYLGAACVVMDYARSLNSERFGGDADIVLESAYGGEDGSLRLRFIYTFDNARLSGCGSALEICFQNGAIRSLRMEGLSVRNLGEPYSSLLETWYYRVAALRVPENGGIADVRLVYRLDSGAEIVCAEWSAIYRERDEVRQS